MEAGTHSHARTLCPIRMTGTHAHALCSMPSPPCPCPTPMPYALCPTPYALCPMPHAHALCPLPMHTPAVVEVGPGRQPASRARVEARGACGGGRGGQQRGEIERAYVGGVCPQDEAVRP